MSDSGDPDLGLDEIIDEAIAALLAIEEAVPGDVLWEMLELGSDREEFIELLESDRRVRRTDSGWFELRSSDVIHRARHGNPPGGRSILDNLVEVLLAHGGPMAFADLNDSIPHRLTKQSLKNRLSADERFMRTDRDSYGLTEWGLEPYDGIVNIMKRSIERQGGEAAIDDVVADLISRFTVNEQSVRTLARTDEFVATGRGRLRVRAGDERVEEQDEPTSASRGCIRIDGRWALRVTVDERLLAGFSVPLPAGFGRALGVSRGEYARITADDGSKLGVSRKALNDSLGRLRRVAESMGLRSGDVLFVIAPSKSGGAVSFQAARQEELAAMAQEERGAALLGTRGTLEPSVVAEALGMPTGSSPAALLATLRLRGDGTLADELAPSLLGSEKEGTVETADIAAVLGF